MVLVLNHAPSKVASAQAPLPTSAKAIAFAAGAFFFPGLLVALLARRYLLRNERQKAKDVVRWFAYGVGAGLVAMIAFAACTR